MSDALQVAIVKQYGIWHVDDSNGLHAHFNGALRLIVAPNRLTDRSPWYPHLASKSWNKGHEDDFHAAYRFALDRAGHADFVIALRYPPSPRIVEGHLPTWNTDEQTHSPS